VLEDRVGCRRVCGQTDGVSADPDLGAVVAQLRAADLDPRSAFSVFDQQDSGCFSYGIDFAGHRWFVKTATTAEASTSLENAIRVHDVCHHPSVVSPVRVFRSPRLTLVYPWRNGVVLNHATIAGSDRSALQRLRQLPVGVIERSIGVVLDAHVEVVRSGLVAVDFYDGCLIYDFDRDEMWLIDLDEYRPGPFVVDVDRLPGSTSYMAPEEFVRGAVIDERTTVFNLGRIVEHLLTSDHGWRGTDQQRLIVDAATDPNRARRYDTVAALLDRWLTTTNAPRPTR
jgi:serine/threonine-protein kinase